MSITLNSEQLSHKHLCVPSQVKRSQHRRRVLIQLLRPPSLLPPTIKTPYLFDPSNLSLQSPTSVHPPSLCSPSDCDWSRPTQNWGIRRAIARPDRHNATLSYVSLDSFSALPSSVCKRFFDEHSVENWPKKALNLTGVQHAHVRGHCHCAERAASRKTPWERSRWHARRRHSMRNQRHLSDQRRQVISFKQKQFSNTHCYRYKNWTTVNSFQSCGNQQKKDKRRVRRNKLSTSNTPHVMIVSSASLFSPIDYFISYHRPLHLSTQTHCNKIIMLMFRMLSLSSQLWFSLVCGTALLWLALSCSTFFSLKVTLLASKVSVELSNVGSDPTEKLMLSGAVINAYAIHANNRLGKKARNQFTVALYTLLQRITYQKTLTTIRRERKHCVGWYRSRLQLPFR